MLLKYSYLTGCRRWNFRMHHHSRLKRTRSYLLLIILVFAALGSCKNDLEFFKINRVPVFSFSWDNLNKETASDVAFSQGKNSLHYYPTGETVLYTRCLMQVNGTNQAGRKYIISVEFDLPTQESYVGIYRPTYTIGVGGIYSFSYLEEISTNVYKSYSLDPDALDSTYFRIQKQNQEEKLILGDFLAKLRNDQNPADKITFYQGIFNDIFYGAQ
jgi:hypothetical protein